VRGTLNAQFAMVNYKPAVHGARNSKRTVGMVNYKPAVHS